MADVKTLEMLAERMVKDAARGNGLNVQAVLSIAEIIRTAIGAPLMWPSRKDGVSFADEHYSGSPDLRLAFNTGVKWSVERYHLDNKDFVRVRNG